MFVYRVSIQTLAVLSMVHQYSFSGEVLDKAVFLVLVASMNRVRITMLTLGTMVLTV